MVVKPYKCFQSQRHGKTHSGQRETTQCRPSSPCQNVFPLFTFWNNRTFIQDYDLWPTTKVEGNIINMWCITMSEAVTVPSLMMTLIVFQWIACEGPTPTHTVLVLHNFFQSKTLKTKMGVNILYRKKPPTSQVRQASQQNPPSQSKRQRGRHVYTHAQEWLRSHIKDPVVHVRVQRTTETRKDLACMHITDRRIHVLLDSKV